MPDRFSLSRVFQCCRDVAGYLRFFYLTQAFDFTARVSRDYFTPSHTWAISRLRSVGTSWRLDFLLLADFISLFIFREIIWSVQTNADQARIYFWGELLLNFVVHILWRNWNVTGIWDGFHTDALKTNFCSVSLALKYLVALFCINFIEMAKCIGNITYILYNTSS